MSFSLSPIGNEQQVTQNGAPLSGGLLYTYLAGSSTPAATYTDSSGATPQSNPIVLNVLGRPENPIWLADGTAYKLFLTDSAGVTQWTIDNVTGVTVSTPSQSEWDTLDTVPTYINATQFSVPGDQTSALLVGGRVRLPCTGGVRYGVITGSVYTSLTTVTVELDSGTLDAGLSSVSVGILSPANSSMPWLKSDSTGLTLRGKLILDADASAALEATTLQQMQTADAAVVRGGIRQTVLSGPVDSSGAAAFGGSTGATTVTAAGTLIVSAANGWNTSGALDRVGSITNPSWTGLSTNGTYYLYLTVNADGTCTTGSTTLAPVYQQGGTYSTTNGQFTFNVSEMVGKVGDGSAANQAYRVYVGEVTVSASVVSAIVWYALRGEAVVETGTLAVSTAYALNHYIGASPRRVTMAIVNVTTELNWVPGDEIQVQPNYNDGTASRVFGMGAQRLAARIVTGPQVLIVPNGSASTLGPITMANWKFRLYLGRGW